MASTANVGYVLVRIMLALGFFNYGKKGILDLTHTRLFTIRSFCRTLEGEGFEVLRHRTIPCNDGGISLGQAVAAAAQRGR